MSNSTLLLLGLVPGPYLTHKLSFGWSRCLFSPTSAVAGGGGGGGVFDQYLGIGEPLRVWNPDPV